jgi:hypothetical protein
MPDKNLQITGGTGAARDAAGRFVKGASGNPAGRPRGSVNRAARAAALLLDGEAEALARKAVEMALAGDGVALRFCLARILGTRRGRPAELDLPPLATVADLAAAMSAVAAAATQGALTPDEALALSQMVESFTRTIEATWEEKANCWRQSVLR